MSLHFFGNRDEFLGRYLAQLSVIPTQERLHSADAARGHIHLRLILKRELGAFDRAAQLPLHGEALERHRVHRCVVILKRIAAGTLREVHREVRVAEQRLNVLAVVGVYRYAYARRDEKFLTAGLYRCCERFHNAASHNRSVFGVLDLRQDKHKFIAAHARQFICHIRCRVGVSRGIAQACCGRLQYLVANAVAQCVVDTLKVIEIDEEHRQFTRVPLGERDRLGQVFLQ